MKNQSVYVVVGVLLLEGEVEAAVFTTPRAARAFAAKQTQTGNFKAGRPGMLVDGDGSRVLVVMKTPLLSVQETKR